MRRADRLFTIVQHLRGGRYVTARRLAERLEVSERTIYRDVDELSRCGVPVEGEAGRGYRLPLQFEIPPLPLSLVARVDDARVYAPTFARGTAPEHFEIALEAIDARRRLDFRYATGGASRHSVP